MQSWQNEINSICSLAIDNVYFVCIILEYHTVVSFRLHLSGCH